MYPILVDGVWVDRMGKPYKPAKPYPGVKPGGIASSARARPAAKPDPEEARRQTAVAKIYWTAYRAGQDAKREAEVPYTAPGWLGARKRPKPKRQWLPGEHRKSKKAGP